MIRKGSRYRKDAIVEVEDGQGRTRQLIELRSVPRAQAKLEVTVGPGERLDHLAHRYYRDPARFWRICDASEVLDPLDLALPGARVRIPPAR